jgi:adenylylsulfate kinase
VPTSASRASARSALRRRLAAELLASLLARSLGKPPLAPLRVGRLQQLVELPIGQVLLAAPVVLVDVARHAKLVLGDGDFWLASGAPPRVVRGDHLVEVLGFHRLAGLSDLARGPQAELFESGSWVVAAEQPYPQDNGDQTAQKHERKRIHRRSSLIPVHATVDPFVYRGRPRYRRRTTQQVPIRSPSPTVEISTNATRQEAQATRSQRWELLGTHGATVWFTGLPGAGKTTIASALELRLLEQGRGAYLLDGDCLRRGICADLGFTRADRDRNVKRVGDLARMIADAGMVAVVALVSPYEATRQAVRDQHDADGLPFVEVFVNTPLRLCTERDPKGMYAQAEAGVLDNFTGVDDPYEPPLAPDVELNPELTVAEAVDTVLRTLDDRCA